MQHLRVLPGKQERWDNLIDAKKAFQKFDKKNVECSAWELHKLGKKLCMPSLVAFSGAWRLPRWPRQRHVARGLRGVWRTWTEQHRLPARVHRIPAGRLESMMAQLYIPDPPKEWTKMEERMEAARLPNRCLVQDDRDRTKVWSVKPSELVYNVLYNIALDPAWKILPTVDVQELGALGYAKGVLGLPAFLTTRKGPFARTGLPNLFVFVKSKCYADDGAHTCIKPNHSCARRVIDRCAIPYRRSWRMLGRGIRGVVQSLSGHEVFAAKDAGVRLRDMLSHLRPPAVDPDGCSRCVRCGASLGAGDVAWLAIDIDQAFESCVASVIPASWTRISSKYEEKHETKHIMVKRGKSCACRLGSAGWNRGWLIFSLRQLAEALQVAAAGTFCCIGNLVLEMAGMTIGGCMSSAAVSVHLASEEQAAFDAGSPAQASGFQFQDGDGAIDWLRYVDDTVSASRLYCSDCQHDFFQRVYEEPVSVVFKSYPENRYPTKWDKHW